MADAVTEDSPLQQTQVTPNDAKFPAASVWEVSEISLLPGIDLESNAEVKTALDAIGSTLKSHPSVDSVIWSRGVENPDKIYIVNEWQSIAAHDEFISSQAQNAVDEKMKDITTTKPLSNHIEYPPSNTPALLIKSSPVVEYLSWFFTVEGASAFKPLWKELQLALEGAEGCKGSTGGWVVEEVEHESLKEGARAKKFTSFIGWESVEAHMGFRKTDSFQEKIQPMREATIGVTMCHIKAFLTH